VAVVILLVHVHKYEERKKINVLISASLILLEPSEPVQACTGIALRLFTKGLRCDIVQSGAKTTRHQKGGHVNVVLSNSRTTCISGWLGGRVGVKSTLTCVIAPEHFNAFIRCDI